MVEIVSLIISFFFGMALMFILLKFRASRHDGQIVITTDPEGKKVFLLELDKDPSEIQYLGSLSFKVTDKENAEYD